MSLHTITINTVKLNGNNYLLWAQMFHVSVEAQRKIGYFLDGLQDMKIPLILIGLQMTLVI